MRAIVELELNRIDNEWFFELGVGYCKTKYHDKPRVFTIGLGLATLYVRW